MASTINATTSSGIVATADNTGSLALQSAGTTVATINSTGVNAGIQMAANTAPAFSAYQSSTQTPAATTWTKVQFQTEEFDTNNNFDSTTNYRFTPTVAGYYQLTSLVNIGANYSGAIAIYKNGSNYKQGISFASAGTTFQSWLATSLVYFNGSTDYAEIYLYITSSQATVATSYQTWFNGFLARSA